MSQEISALVVDCHNLVRQGLSRILADEPSINVVGSTGDDSQLSQLASKLKPNVLLLDVNLPNVETITNSLVKTHPGVNILILSTYCQIDQALALLTSGAIGYICKDATLQDLVTAVQHAAKKEMFLDPTVAKAVIDQLAQLQTPQMQNDSSPQNWLTDRELDVLRLLCEGYMDKEIAKQLCLSIRTINGHLRHIYTKLGVHSRTEAMHLALEQGWVSLTDK